MQLMLLTYRTYCEAFTKRPKAFRSSSIWWKQHKPNQTEQMFRSHTSMSTLWPSRISSHQTNTMRIPAIGKNSRHKNKPGQRGRRSFVWRMLQNNVVKSTRLRWSTFWWVRWSHFHGRQSPIRIEWNDGFPGTLPWKYCGGGQQQCFSTGWSVGWTCIKHGYPGLKKRRAGQGIRTTLTRIQRLKTYKGYRRCNGKT